MRPIMKIMLPFILAAVGSALVFLCVIMLVKFMQPKLSVGLCRKPGCLRHVQELKSSMNTEFKPCSDFYSFVCGSWKPAGVERSMIERIFAHSREVAVGELEGDPKETPVPLAAQYFQSCMANRSATSMESEIKKFKSFKRGLGLGWPEQWPESGEPHVPPLKILLNLTVNWNINLIFKVRGVPAYQNRPKLIYITRGDWKHRGANPTDEEFVKLVDDECDYLGVPPPGDLLDLKGHVQTIISETVAFNPDPRDEQKRTLKEIDQQTPSQRDRWLEYLNEIFRTEYTSVWNRDDIVLIEHPAILANLQRLLEKVPEASLRAGLSWVFVRNYLWAVIGKPQLRMKGDASQLQTFRKQTCLAHVETTFGLLVSARHIHERFSKTLRDTIVDLFDMVRERIKIKFANSSWIDAIVKKKSYGKLGGIWKSLLPDSRFFSKYTLAGLYKNFPSLGDSFMDNVVSVAKAFRKTMASDDYFSIYSKRLGIGGVASRYGYYYNSVSMDVGALEPPMLYVDGSFAMTYGSLGTILAASMVRAFDEHGVAYNDKGEDDPWWSTGLEEYDKRVKCNLGGAPSEPSTPSGGNSSTNPPSSPLKSKARVNPLFWRALAIDASFEAYRHAVRMEHKVDVHPLDGLESYTDDQVFFMTYCLMTCAVDRNGDECNVPLRHLNKFSTTFKCSPKDTMNPKEKCTFFD
ncbi:hypothetical protein V5799_000385 [Amblyomma americanum]|uniref:M13 family peptidase n=1 Tax=Amblyomma americanum TaxID=6943 RepID=A0AAQ4D377_AMBAM